MKSFKPNTTPVIVCLLFFAAACKKETVSTKTAESSIASNATTLAATAQTIYLNGTWGGHPVYQYIDVPGKIHYWDFVPHYQDESFEYLNDLSNVPLINHDTIIWGGPNVYKLNKLNSTVFATYNYAHSTDRFSGIGAVYSPTYYRAKKYTIFVTQNILRCIDATGTLIWDKLGTFGCAPSLSHGNLFITFNNKLACFNPSTGKTKWKFTPVKQYTNNSVCATATTVYSVDNQANIYANDAATGALVWQKKYGTITGPPSGLPAHIAYADNKIFLVTSALLRCLDATTGDELWNSSAAVAADFGQNSFCVLKDKVIIPGLQGGVTRLFAFNLTGGLVWVNADQNYYGYSPVEAGGTVYVTYISSTGVPGIAGIGTTSGLLEWDYPINARPYSMTIEKTDGSVSYPIDCGERDKTN